MRCIRTPDIFQPPALLRPPSLVVLSARLGATFLVVFLVLLRPLFLVVVARHRVTFARFRLAGFRLAVTTALCQQFRRQKQWGDKESSKSESMCPAVHGGTPA
jgi:hypothetical protein